MSRISEIIIFNYSLNFYPIFQDDDFYFYEKQVANLVNAYKKSVENMRVYDDRAIKGVVEIENQENNIKSLKIKGGDCMKKIAKWLAAISLATLVIAWGLMGLKLLDNDYLITAEAYTSLIALIVFFICIMYLKFTNRCPHCGKAKVFLGKYCPYCGKEV